MEMWKRKYYFSDRGFEIILDIASESIDIELLFDNPHSDSENNKHRYSTILTEKDMDEYSFTLKRFVNCFEFAYEDQHTYILDFHEKTNPPCMEISIYEEETSETIVCVTLLPDSS